MQPQNLGYAGISNGFAKAFRQVFRIVLYWHGDGIKPVNVGSPHSSMQEFALKGHKNGKSAYKRRHRFFVHTT